jgi:hypothetical protein
MREHGVSNSGLYVKEERRDGDAYVPLDTQDGEIIATDTGTGDES